MRGPCLILAILAVTARADAMDQPEWTLEQAEHCWKPMVRPVQHVGVPGYQFQVGVMWDGALVFGPLGFRELEVMQKETAPLGDNLLHVSIAYGDPPRFIDRKGTNSAAIRRFLEQGRLPIPHVVTRDGDLEWEETAFAHLLGRRLRDGIDARPDDVLVAEARFHVRNTGYAERTAHLWLHFGDTSQVQFGYKCRQGDALAPAIAHHFEPPYGLVGDRIRYLLLPVPPSHAGWLKRHDEAPISGVKASGKRLIEWKVTLAPGEEAALRLAIPYGLVARSAAKRILAANQDSAFRETVRYWSSQIRGPGQITTPDPFVNDYLAAVAGQMAQQTACRIHTGLWMYKTSPNHYEGYWPCNAAKALPTFDLRGLTKVNERVLGGFTQRQTDDVRGMEKGAMGQEQHLAGEGYARIPGFLGNFGEWTANPLLISHGLGMWALASHYRIARDDRWLGNGPGSPLHAMIQAFDWVSAQRRRTMREVDGKRVAYWGLLPAASAHDWLAGNTVFNDAYCIYGMSEVVRLLREVGHPRAEEMANELADYRACLHDRYAEATSRARPVPLPDGTTIPFVPRMVQELDWAKPDWTYTGYGPLRAGALGALDPHDPMVDESLTFLEAGIPKGEGPYFSAPKDYPDIADSNWADISDPSAERHYLWRHYVEYETMWPIGGPLFLARDDLPRYFEWLFNNLAVVLHREWRVGVESLDGVPSCAPGDGERWQMIRRMFVNETGGWDGSEQSLFLLQAIPRSWLRPGARISVKKMGTWFGGKIDLEQRVSDDGESVVATVRLRHLRVAPKEIRIRLRSGDDRALAKAAINGFPSQVLPGDILLLPAGKDATFRVVGHFAPPTS